MIETYPYLGALYGSLFLFLLAVVYVIYRVVTYDD